jgi:hypothetical protein
MGFAAALHDIPRPAWIAALVFGFVWHWPIGLAILAYLIGTGQIGHRVGRGRWYNTAPDGAAPAGWGTWGCGGRGARAAPSGNAAFDAYRAETLRRLEDEQREFLAYLERLRQARDKAEFDRFMAERRGDVTPPQPEQV